MSGQWQRVTFTQDENAPRMLASALDVWAIGQGGSPRSALLDLARRTGGTADTVNGRIMFARSARSASARLEEFRKFFLTTCR